MSQFRLHILSCAPSPPLQMHNNTASAGRSRASSAQQCLGKHREGHTLSECLARADRQFHECCGEAQPQCPSLCTSAPVKSLQHTSHVSQHHHGIVKTVKVELHSWPRGGTVLGIAGRQLG